LALKHARAAIANGGDDPQALVLAAFALNLIGTDREAALTAIDRALAINPSSARAHFVGSLIEAFGGNFDVAANHAEEAMRLSPFDPLTYVLHLGRGFEAAAGSRWDEAAAHFKNAVQVGSGQHVFYFLQASMEALAGKLDEARSTADLGLGPAPEWRARSFSEMGLTKAVADALIAGARLLGLPE
jgi:adenylate cyclase